MKILGIETSCDENAAAIITEKKEILGHVIYSQIDDHIEYGGVVPEISARAHIQQIDKVIAKCLQDANLKISDIDAIAATSGPGLIGGVIVGCVVAKTLAMILNKPFIAINHLEAHTLTIRLVDDVQFPYLMFLASGGHTMIAEVEAIGKYNIICETLDDAIGEAFDKVAKMLGLNYPGGPIIEQKAKLGDPNRFVFPTPMTNRDNLDFSLSGLKTAVRREIENLGELNVNDICDICASFQNTIAKIIKNKLERAFTKYDNHMAKQLVLAGGVAANQFIAEQMKELCTKYGFSLHIPPMKLCTDNAAMVAWAGIERLKLGLTSPLSFTPRPRWSLSELT